MTDRAEVKAATTAWNGLTKHERLWISERGDRMLALYIALDALAAASPYALSIDALD